MSSKRPIDRSGSNDPCASDRGQPPSPTTGDAVLQYGGLGIAYVYLAYCPHALCHIGVAINFHLVFILSEGGPLLLHQSKRAANCRYLAQGDRLHRVDVKQQLLDRTATEVADTALNRLLSSVI